ncbi:Asp-tRNA(Asn)/Glu-tRNA(Gln) amidotransferase subunit GatC [Salinarchaeum sp. IM2453]|uniref:Asp-tRNA(Asn)/Glu-tRNA(Gln) amidotransferase subunit GatC n=1 Tax=Salinarchaeum sp. IM2453 TaxID=2862870 RepID=UPI001C8379A6|nr:Asp-tRNA(Asn)/Glu-tRNA(Gln) amidotransferase subunit GatC [Salinarchaeum sp. IM2453]QZA88145.1 Asp-tRNA(Asn)/Glu-tRNA(Gln) amidotransferase subunit GatC [Salinarchaeum sp. IM2453]
MDNSRVDSEDIHHIAELARIDIDEEDADTFADQLDDVLDYFASLEEIPDVDREAELTNVMRADEVRDSLTQEEALKNAEETEDGYFKGPNVS